VMLTEGRPRLCRDRRAGFRCRAGVCTALPVLTGTRSDSWCLVERSGFGVRCRQAAIIFSFAIGIASRKVCIGVLPKHQRP
jgi:hypothetical protein